MNTSLRKVLKERQADFRDETDFRLGAIEQLIERRREEERKTSKKAPT